MLNLFENRHSYEHRYRPYRPSNDHLMLEIVKLNDLSQPS